MQAKVDESRKFDLSEYISGDYKLSMWIPSDLAGRVVGKKGVVITNLQRETHAKLINALSPVGQSLWIAVVIIGDWRSIRAAYEAVYTIVSGEVDDVVLEFNLNNRKPLFLARKGNLELLKTISAQTGTRIYIPDNFKDNHHTEPVTLEGSFEQVCRAILAIECQGQPVPDKAEVLGENNFEMEAKRKETEVDVKERATTSRSKQSLTRTIDIPINLVGLLLSRKGQVKISILNQIQGMTGTVISKILSENSATSNTFDPKDPTSNEVAIPFDPLTKGEPVAVSDAEFVPFKIVGYDHENIDMAFDHLQRIIGGERIKSVIDALKVSSKMLTRAARGEKSSKIKK